jgi:hypothetical protein
LAAPWLCMFLLIWWLVGYEIVKRRIGREGLELGAA